jgi:hypothetical protein
VDLSLVRQAAALRVRERRKARLIHVTAPRADNSFLHNQDGLFLLDREASLRREELNRFERLDEVVHEIEQEVRDAGALSRLDYYQQGLASPMALVTAPVELAMDVLDLLDRDFYNRGRIMPTHDNVVKSLEFLRTLNAHRRSTGELASVTLGPKY